MLLWGAVAQVDHEARAEIGDVHNLVLSAFEHVSRQMGRDETGLRIAAGTYATAPHILAVLGPLAGGLRSPTRVLRATLPGVDSENPQDAIQVVAGARRDPCAGALGVKVDAIWQRRVRGM